MEFAEIVLRIVELTISPLLTGVIGYWFAKYTFANKKTDKLEIAYNCVYYKLYKYIKDNEINDTINYDDFERYVNSIINKYYRYFSSTTLTYMDLLINSKTKKERKTIYRKIKKDIQKYNHKFRFLLGYPEPLIANFYKYVTYENVLFLGLFVCLSMSYFLAFISNIFVSALHEILIVVVILLCASTVLCFLLLINLIKTILTNNKRGKKNILS